MIYIHAAGDSPFGWCTKREKREKNNLGKKKKCECGHPVKSFALGIEPLARLTLTSISHTVQPVVTQNGPPALSRKNKHLTTQGPRSHHWVIHCYTYHGGFPPPPPSERTIYTWAVVHTSRIHTPSGYTLGSSTDTNRHARRWTHTHTRVDAAGRKKTNTHRGLVS